MQLIYISFQKSNYNQDKEQKLKPLMKTCVFTLHLQLFLYPFHPCFHLAAVHCLLKTLWKKEICSYQAIYPLHTVFSTSPFFKELSTNFIGFRIVVCKFFQFGLIFGKELTETNFSSESEKINVNSRTSSNGLITVFFPVAISELFTPQGLHPDFFFSCIYQRYQQNC